MALPNRRLVTSETTQSPGDVVMLTAAVRELKRELKRALADGAGELIECHDPLIHRSNTGPWPFIHGYTQFLGERLGAAVKNP